MSTALAPRLGFKFMMTVQQGPDAGVSFQLLPPRVTIGRDPENHIALNDSRVSRQAAVIEFTPKEILIQDLSQRQSLMVNGEIKTTASIKDGDILRIGSSEMMFIVEALEMPAVPTAFPTNSPPTPFMTTPQGARASVVPFQGARAPATGFSAPSQFDSIAPPPGFDIPRQSPPNFQRSSSSNTSVAKPNGKMGFYLILLVVGGGLIWLLNSKKPEKPVEPELRTSEAVDRDIKSSATHIDEIIKKRSFRTDEERTRFEESQRHYLEGFRDYQKGQFIRAMRSFETARAIDPDNELARRYFKLAEKQRDEMIADLTLDGRRYKDKQMYSRCSASFEKVLDAISNKDDQKYKQAESLKKECDLLTGERFQ